MKIILFALIPLILSIGIIPAVSFGDIDSPRKQIADGVKSENVTCTEGLVIVLKSSDNSPACIKPSSVEKLIQRGWAIEITHTESDIEQIHQGYSATADQYEVGGNVVSNSDISAPLWNPRDKTQEQIAERAAYMTSKYDLVRTDDQQKRAAEAREKYSDAIVINSVMPSSVGMISNTAENYETGLKRNHDAGITMVSTTAFAFPADGTASVLERLDNNLAVMEKLGMDVVKDTDTIRQAKQDGKMVVMFNSQGSDYVIDDMSILKAVKSKGLHVANFVYNVNNALAGGGDKQDMGVTELGQEFIKQGNANGVIIDCSHSSTQTCIDAAKYSQKPIVASHSNAYALHPVNRNINDEGLMAIASTDGVVCNTGVGIYLNDELDSSPEALAVHVEYSGNLMGRDKTCFSTDYVHNYLEYTTDFLPQVDIYPPEKGYGAAATNIAAEHIWGVVGVLEDKYGWTDEEIRGYLGENLMRVYDANWK